MQSRSCRRLPASWPKLTEPTISVSTIGIFPHHPTSRFPLLSYSFPLDDGSSIARELCCGCDLFCCVNKPTFSTTSYSLRSFLLGPQALAIMTVSIFKSQKPMTAGQQDQNVENISGEEEYRPTDIPHTRIGKEASRNNEQRVDSEMKNPGRYQEQEPNARETPLPPVLPRGSPSEKWVGDENPKNSNESPRSLEQGKDSPQKASNSSKPSPNRRQALPFVIIGLSLSVFLVSLDRTIITTVGFSISLDISPLTLKGNPPHNQRVPFLL